MRKSSSVLVLLAFLIAGNVNAQSPEEQAAELEKAVADLEKTQEAVQARQERAQQILKQVRAKHAALEAVARRLDAALERAGKLPDATPEGPAPGDSVPISYRNSQVAGVPEALPFWPGRRFLVVPLPATDAAAEHARALPSERLFLRGDRFTLLNSASGKPWQSIQVSGKVVVRGPNFKATADQAIYNAEKNILRLDGCESGPAILRKDDGEVVEGRRIWYGLTYGLVAH